MDTDEPHAGLAGGTTDSALDELVFECLERLATEGGTALADLCRAHPAEAQALLQRITALVAMGLIDVSLDNDGERKA